MPIPRLVYRKHLQSVGQLGTLVHTDGHVALIPVRPTDEGGLPCVEAPMSESTVLLADAGTVPTGSAGAQELTCVFVYVHWVVVLSCHFRETYRLSTSQDSFRHPFSFVFRFEVLSCHSRGVHGRQQCPHTHFQFSLCNNRLGRSCNRAAKAIHSLLAVPIRYMRLIFALGFSGHFSFLTESDAHHMYLALICGVCVYPPSPKNCTVESQTH